MCSERSLGKNVHSRVLKEETTERLMVRRVRMGCPVWLLPLAVLSAAVSEVRPQCWENPHCRDLGSEESILDCIKLCRSDLTAESPFYPGDGHLQAFLEPIPNNVPVVTISPTEQEASESGSQQEAKRSYSMEHFRWGKPVGRKRRPIKVYTNGAEEESAEALPTEMRRELANNEVIYPLEGSTFHHQEKKDGTYKMNHFRWSGPPANKRYGGFMKSWDERSQKPLLTLIKNVINKDVHQKDQ
ncbi:proopiomelanocortin a [Brachyhypopomus gauderio]|uniref:proopiomelanocortin a n=1 Tax=Brachyhypopomus gauderio TaxID=698409 RepID=UPI004042B149